MRITNSLFLLFAIFLATSCQDPVYTPKPRSFPKVVYPERTYQQLENQDCPFVFEHPTYTILNKEKTYFDEAPPTSCWFDIYYPNFDGSVHFTYYPLDGDRAEFERLKEETFRLANWHNKRANYIDELVINTDNGVGGVAFNIEGPAASPFQFFLTDSSQHYLRGALYFNTEANADSLRPIADFVRVDILHLMETFQWVD